MSIFLSTDKCSSQLSSKKLADRAHDRKAQLVKIQRKLIGDMPYPNR